MFILAVCLNAIVAAIPAIAQQPAAVCDDPRLMVGAAAVELTADKSMVIAGGIHPRHVDGQEGELRAVAVVLQQPDSDTLAIVSCDVLMFSRDLLELANDWIGYLPNREAHRLGGYQVWTGLHSYAEPGTGERMVDEAIAMLEELAGTARGTR